MVAPTNVLDDVALELLGWDLDAFRELWKQVRNTPGVAEKVAQVFGHYPWASDKQDDVDHSLYSGGFLSPQDRRLCQQVIHTPPAELGRLFLPLKMNACQKCSGATAGATTPTPLPPKKPHSGKLFAANV